MTNTANIHSERFVATLFGWRPGQRLREAMWTATQLVQDLNVALKNWVIAVKTLPKTLAEINRKLDILVDWHEEDWPKPEVKEIDMETGKVTNLAPAVKNKKRK